MTAQERVLVLRWAERAQERAARLRERGDYIAARAALETAARYRRLAFAVAS